MVRAPGGGLLWVVRVPVIFLGFSIMESQEGLEHFLSASVKTETVGN